MIGRTSKTALNVIGWPSSSFTSSTFGAASGLRPRPSSSSKTTLFTMASAASPTISSWKRRLITSRGVLPGRNPGSLTLRASSLARRSTSACTSVGFDLEAEGLPDRTLLGVLDFQGTLLVGGARRPRSGRRGGRPRTASGQRRRPKRIAREAALHLRAGSSRGSGGTADARALGARAREGVGVRFPPSAPPNASAPGSRASKRSEQSVSVVRCPFRFLSPSPCTLPFVRI